jgi:hypothetical protein
MSTGLQGLGQIGTSIIEGQTNANGWKLKDCTLFSF